MNTTTEQYYRPEQVVLLQSDCSVSRNQIGERNEKGISYQGVSN